MKTFNTNAFPQNDTEGYNNKLRTIIELAPDAFFHGDSKGNLITFNNKAIELTGYSKAELLTMNFSDLFPSSVLKYKPLKYDFLKKEGEIKKEREIIRKNGERIQVEINLKAMPDGTFQCFIRDITERKCAEEALRKSEEHYKMISDLTSDYIFLLGIDTAGKVTLDFVSENFSTITGRRKEDVEEIESWAGTFHHDDLGSVMQLLQSMCESKQESELECRTFIKNGRLRWIKIYARSLWSEAEKRITSIVGSVKDITEQKLAETALKKSESFLNNIIEQSPTPMWVSDENGTLIRINKACLEMLNITEGEVIGKYNVLKDDIVEEQGFLPLIKNVFEKGETARFELVYDSVKLKQLKLANYAFVILEVNIFPVKNEDGKVINAIIQHIDITKRKQAELALIAAKEKAEESEEKYKQIFDNILDHIFILEVTDKQRYKILVVNPIQKKEIGLLEPGKYIDECLPDKLYKQFVVNYDRCIQEQRLLAYEETINNHIFYTQLIPIKNSNGRIYRLIGIAKNITHEKQLTNQLIGNIENLKSLNTELSLAKEKAEESDRLKTVFLQNLSHEIRTPMNAIMGFSELIKDGYYDRRKFERYSDIINRRCNDLLDIINDLLDIAQIESGQLPVNMGECNINLLFEELTSFFSEYQNKTDKQQIKFRLQPMDNLSENIIVTDIVKLKQVLINLITNAFKFTEKGTITGGCRFNKNQNLLFYITDTGIGIPPDKHEAVFERFFRLNQVRAMNIGGNGLGLSIVKGLVGLLGGEIFLKSEPGKGSTFSFTIPFKTPQPLQHDDVLNIEKPACSFNKTILIVEDDIYNAEYLKEIMSGIGLKTIHAWNGKEAVEVSKTKSIDLVLMDIRLPDITGYEATRQIRRYKPKLKIIAQTAYASNDEKQKAVNAGCNDYLSKPTKKDILLTMLNKHLVKSSV